ncbi:MAG: amidohydrolase family protein [Candidatus Lokiarchaeota archaeon]|nr:amidohydrolase family protein [Candidatus Lokiarchaeota archaeon]
MRRIIDAHAHLYKEKEYEKRLLKTMDQCGIEKCCISGLGDLFYCGTNEDVYHTMKEYPDRYIGAYFIRPGVSAVSEIHDAFTQGFHMIKVSIPKAPYDDLSYYGYWKQAEEYHMPILFHTGVITYTGNPRGELINSWYMHPMRLEPIANEFPDLNIILAHLGVHWNKDAAELCRMRSNVYVDLTGEAKGWRSRADVEGMDKYLWWKDAWKKVVFGTDVYYEKIPKILQEDKNRLEKYKVSEKTQKLIFSGNISKMLGI